MSYLSPSRICRNISLVVICLFFISACTSAPLSANKELYQYEHNVVLKKQLEIIFPTNSTYHIDTINTGWDSVSASNYEVPIKIALADMGYKNVSDIRKSYFGVECRFYHALGLPVMGRHFDLHWRYLKKLNIKVVEAGSEKLLGEIEYTRPRLSYHPNHVPEFMVNKLFKYTDAPVRPQK